MLDVMNQDYIDTARAKGVSEKRVTFVHMLRKRADSHYHSGRPPVGSLLGGAVTTETIFAWPGIGRFIVESHQQQGHPLCAGCGGHAGGES